MKRSKTAALLLMSTAPLLLTACDRNQSREGLYTSVEACVAQTNDSNTCQQAFAKAQQDAVATAPRFANREACEASYGKEKCAERNDGASHSFFGPLMTGFFLSQMMRNGVAANGFNSAPAFRDSNGGWQRPATGTGGVYRGGAGTATVPVNATPNRAVTVSRSGFGTSGSSRSFGG
ncbi:MULTISPECIES: DUF1190 domain-containing protein [Rhodanobacter]|uniref:DUF1190 domain-containing protein n=1 Tax=Rhodanobacter TaxID=75309 RepID=UPI000415F7BB|nr:MULTISPECIES: DUF1190 domain-containing protein [Rhodanobacter]KZC19173.1 hypothetical protein RHOFW104R3_32675 [Rhodanobacter denitrificans]UJJ51413.1 DUF1190 domain-containing protein [Rhodanobacter denitrificans]UJM94159.1 DUF1190 domain-containing protein [Rhodanobacter denitrificans]UJM97688.1 DUF1190 domain-containing protein [Rhodanobacter denitrificans]UJN22897.1 DUF1190 domain-containing protein [Rhodanobacter denitrificans]